MTTIMRDRIETNYSVYTDVCFTGSTSGTVLTVTAIQFGTIAPGAPLFGVGVASGTTITGILTGIGGVGTYSLSTSQTLSSRTLAAGQTTLTQPVKVTVQLDFHSANVGDSADMVATISTLFRSEIATASFDSSGTGVWPLYADEAKQAPFINAEQQFETRWVLDAVLQSNQVVSWPLQFASAVTINFQPADA